MVAAILNCLYLNVCRCVWEMERSSCGCVEEGLCVARRKQHSQILAWKHLWVEESNSSLNPERGG